MAILVHQHERLDEPRYFLHEIAELWRAEGLDVRVVPGVRSRIDARLAILHVDLTVTPAGYARLVERYPRVLNGAVTDISKRRISADVLGRRDRYPGPVIVKTDRNYGGRPERRLAQRAQPRREAVRTWRDRLPWPYRAIWTGDYPIFESVDRVPRAVWFNPAFVVQPFLPERRDGLWCLRTWMFLGDASTHSLSYSESPIVKSHTVVRREVLDEVPAELQDIRNRLGFDYGKFDYALVDGRVVLYDTNRTPALGGLPEARSMANIQVLARGIGAFL